MLANQIAKVPGSPLRRKLTRSQRGMNMIIKRLLFCEILLSLPSHLPFPCLQLLAFLRYLEWHPAQWIDLDSHSSIALDATGLLKSMRWWCDGFSCDTLAFSLSSSLVSSCSWYTETPGVESGWKMLYATALKIYISFYTAMAPSLLLWASACLSWSLHCNELRLSKFSACWNIRSLFPTI